MADNDYALALSLQEEFTSSSVEITDHKSSHLKRQNNTTSIVDECWEMIDPTPNITELFLQFNDMFFEGKLGGVEVRWSPRMTVCAGLCCYAGRERYCSIRLSLPLLKLRPRRDLVQTLLHEMIHALLFVTHNNKDHDSHGPEFHKHMHRINKVSGTHITVYHNFHDEVKLYKTHWWKCNGRCQRQPPYYGMVKRSMNRAPSKNDMWWASHQDRCGGTFIKVKEPEEYGKNKKMKNENKVEKNGKDSGLVKIDKFIKKETGGKLWQEDKSDDKKLWQEDKSDSRNKENDNTNNNNTNNQTICFPGRGFVLGGSKNGTSTITQPWLAEKTPFTNKKKETDSGLAPEGNTSQGIASQHDKMSNNNTELNTKLKKRKRSHNNNQTILEAFKKVEKSPEIILIDDSPSQSKMLDCPSCYRKIQENLINSHLDQCLV